MPYTLVPASTRRSIEGVRPIFWQHRTKAYLARTQNWPDFPAHKWNVGGVFDALTDAALLHRHTLSDARKSKAKESWGEALSSVQDVQSAFERYYKGTTSILPWHDAEKKSSGPHDSELASLASSGHLVINSQPSVNGVHSGDVTYGWGPAGGYVYAKGYVEAFVSPQTWQTLQAKLKATPSLTWVAATATGPVYTDLEQGSAVAVAWGVFPGKEIIQPLVVDPFSFAAWRDEAFSLWTVEWASLYEEGSASKALLKDIASTWYLVGIVENDYVSGDVLKVLKP